MLTTAEGYSVAKRELFVEDGFLNITLLPTSAMVLKYESGCQASPDILMPKTK